MTELLAHHDDVVRRLAAKPGLAKDVVSDYIEENLHWGRMYIASLGRPLVKLVGQARKGDEFIRLPENTANGDVLCKACSEFGHGCWHGHREYTFTFPNGTNPVILNRKWNNVSIDFQINKRVPLFVGDNYNDFYQILKLNDINTGGFGNRPCPGAILPENIRMLQFLRIQMPTSTSSVVKFIHALNDKIMILGGSGTETLFRLSDAKNGTSLMPEAYILEGSLPRLT